MASGSTGTRPPRSPTSPGSWASAPPSLYAAFGDKRTLFDEVVRVYSDTHGALGDRALAEEPTAREGIARMLREAAAVYTDPAHPHGCLIVHAATNCTSPEVEAMLRERRNANIAAIEARIGRTSGPGCCPPAPTPPRSPGTPVR